MARRHILRFTTQGLMITIAVIACGLYWLRGTIIERQVVSQIESSGGTVFYYRTSGNGILNSPTREPTISDRVLGTRHIYLVRVMAETEDSVSMIAKLPYIQGLRGLSVVGRHFTDTQLEMIANLEQLEQLELIDTAVTKPAVQKLRRSIPHCEVVVVHTN